jgi:hypothetical protein
MIHLFADLSAKLCDDQTLPLSLVQEYYEILRHLPHFNSLMERYQGIKSQNFDDIIEQIHKQLLSVPEYRLVIKDILKLWYLGRIEGLQILKGARYYFFYEALIWKVLHAHPVGLTGGYYGYWSYKPEF